MDKFDMYAWAAYLRGQADVLGLEIIDTTDLDLAAATQKLANRIERFATKVGIQLESIESKARRKE